MLLLEDISLGLWVFNYELNSLLENGLETLVYAGAARQTSTDKTHSLLIRVVVLVKCNIKLLRIPLPEGEMRTIMNLLSDDTSRSTFHYLKSNSDVPDFRSRS